MIEIVVFRRHREEQQRTFVTSNTKIDFFGPGTLMSDIFIRELLLCIGFNYPCGVPEIARTRQKKFRLVRNRW